MSDVSLKEFLKGVFEGQVMVEVTTYGGTAYYEYARHTMCKQDDPTICNLSDVVERVIRTTWNSVGDYPAFINFNIDDMWIINLQKLVATTLRAIFSQKFPRSVTYVFTPQAITLGNDTGFSLSYPSEEEAQLLLLLEDRAVESHDISLNECYVHAWVAKHMYYDLSPLQRDNLGLTEDIRRVWSDSWLNDDSRIIGHDASIDNRELSTRCDVVVIGSVSRNEPKMVADLLNSLADAYSNVWISQSFINESLWDNVHPVPGYGDLFSRMDESDHFIPIDVCILPRFGDLTRDELRSARDVGVDRYLLADSQACMHHIDRDVVDKIIDQHIDDQHILGYIN